MWTRLALLAPALLVVTGCSSSPPADEPDAAPSPSRVAAAISSAVPKSPPPILLITEHGELTATPGSSCWQSGDSVRCADMVNVSVRDLPNVGDPTTLHFRFSMPDARFTAYLDEIGGRGHAEIDAANLGNGVYRLVPNATPGRFRVLLDGATRAGHAPVEFVWTVPGGAAP